MLLALDTKHRLLSHAIVSVGSADRTFIRGREVFRDALLLGASAIVLGHNHPSGDPTASQDDLDVTRRLGRAGLDLGIPVLDHLIVAGRDWRSLAREHSSVFPGRGR